MIMQQESESLSSQETATGKGVVCCDREAFRRSSTDPARQGLAMKPGLAMSISCENHLLATVSVKYKYAITTGGTTHHTLNVKPILLTGWLCNNA